MSLWPTFLRSGLIASNHEESDGIMIMSSDSSLESVSPVHLTVNKHSLNLQFSWEVVYFDCYCKSSPKFCCWLQYILSVLLLIAVPWNKIWCHSIVSKILVPLHFEFVIMHSMHIYTNMLVSHNIHVPGFPQALEIIGNPGKSLKKFHAWKNHGIWKKPWIIMEKSWNFVK